MSGNIEGQKKGAVAAMKIIKKILYGILVFFILCCGVIILCAVKPELSSQIADTLKLNENEYYLSPVPGNGAGYIDDMGNEQNPDVTFSEESEGNEGPDFGTPSAVPVSNVSGLDMDDPQNAGVEIDPATYGIIVPPGVAGKSGYQPIQDESSEIDDEEAEEIQEELGVGETGDGLTFDLWFYPYYAMLDDTGQHLYRQIYANAMALNESFAPIETISAGGLRNVFAAVYNDHPELFWMDTAYACKFKRSGECVEIDLQFNSTAGNLSQSKSIFEAKVKEITDGAQGLGSNYEKEKYVHDSLVAGIDYVASAPMNQSAYSALVNGKTVCAGYARAFQYILQQLGIPCYYCTGYAGESHAWNIVALEDGYYNVDVTWDDTGAGTYDYFNKSDGDYASNHLRQDLSVNLPPCNGAVYRNLEAPSEEENEGEEDVRTDLRRSLEELGLSAEGSLKTLDEYYNDCYQKVVDGGKGRFSFHNVISGQVLFNNVYSAYQTDDYRKGYMDKAISELGASTYRIDWAIEELQGGYYLVTHDMTIQ